MVLPYLIYRSLVDSIVYMAWEFQVDLLQFF